MVECLTQERGAAGLSLNASNLLSRNHLHIHKKFAQALSKYIKSIWVGVLPDLYVMRRLSRFLKHVLTRNRSYASAYSRILSSSLSGSGLPYP